MVFNYQNLLDRGGKMKKSTKFLLGAAMGMGAFALYKKYNPNVMMEIKNSVNKMSREASKNIENMM